MIRQHFNATGGGPPTPIQLTEFEKRIEGICNSFAIHGDNNLDDMGFGQRKLLESSQNDESIDINSDENENLSDESNVRTPKKTLSVKRRILFDENFSTPRKRIKTSSICSTPKSSLYENRNKDFEKALNLQMEQIDLLKKSLKEQKETNTRLDYIIDLLENMEHKFIDDK